MHVSPIAQLGLLSAILGASACSSTRFDARADGTAEPSTETTPSTAEAFSLTPILVVPNVDEAAAFYTKAFDAELLSKSTGPDGRPNRAELQVGDSIVKLDAEGSEPRVRAPSSLGGTASSLIVYVEDASQAARRAIGAGATEQMPVRERFWGDRYGTVVDPFGHVWAFATRVEELTNEQMRQRAQLAFANRGSTSERAWKTIEGTPASDPTPEPYGTVTMSLTVERAAQVIEAYEQAFGAEEFLRIPGPDGKLIHAEVRIGDSILMLADASPQMGSKSPSMLGGSTMLIDLSTERAESALNQARRAGARVIDTPPDAYPGEPYGVVLGPGGFVWTVTDTPEGAD